MQVESVSYYLCVISWTSTGTINADERGNIGSTRKMETCAFKPILASLFLYLHIHSGICEKMYQADRGKHI